MKKKFGPAFEGLFAAAGHKAVQIQMMLGIAAVIAGFVLKLTYFEWLIFILCIGLVITAEILNTAIEEIGSYLTKLYDPKIKLIKDLAAGAVLTASFTALTAAVVIFLHHIF